MDISRRIFLVRTAVCGAVAAVAPGALAAGHAPVVVDLKILGRKVVAPEGPIRVTRGDRVELHCTTDETVELHLHGYDIELRVRPGKPAVMKIDARAAGRFPITSHGWGEGGHGHEHGHGALTYLEVHPR